MEHAQPDQGRQRTRRRKQPLRPLNSPPKQSQEGDEAGSTFADSDNESEFAWLREFKAPPPGTYPRDPLVNEVLEKVSRRMKEHFGLQEITQAGKTLNTTTAGNAPSAETAAPAPAADAATAAFFDHSSAPRVSTDAVITKALKEQYPNLQLIVVPESISMDVSCDLFGFAAAGHASYTMLEDDSNLPSSMRTKVYFPPPRRMDGAKGVLGDVIGFGKFLYRWDDAEFIVYFIDGRDGVEAYPRIRNYYILTADTHKAEELILAVGGWSEDLHNEVWVFDGGWWGKSTELWESVQKATWDAVILDSDMKKALINDHNSFFDSRETYANLKVPWKRGIIYHGPPGNGKTISIKATMHMLLERNPSVPTLYVRSLESFMGPEYSIHSIFEKAREFAPCYLVFEDIDTIITPDIRSYFLNEVDGLKSNDGIFMIASTNHLDQLDPGISQRPSRFDRKYYFPDPDVDQRELYCHFWQSKLKDNKDIDFPDQLCRAIAEITDKFSFAYIQEAFVATLLAIARRSDDEADPDCPDSWVLLSDDGDDGDDNDIEKNVLWVEIKKQVKILRDGIDKEKGNAH